MNILTLHCYAIITLEDAAMLADDELISLMLNLESDRVERKASNGDDDWAVETWSGRGSKSALRLRCSNGDSD